MKALNSICWPVLLWLSLALSTAAMAQDKASDQAALPPTSMETGTDATEQQIPSLTESVLPSLTRIGLSLCVIVAVIYLSVFLLRKLSGNRIGGKKGSAIQIIDQTYLAPKKSVCLLKLADRAVLIGITDTNINLLTELEWDALPHETGNRGNNLQSGFPKFLNDAAGRLFNSRKKGAHHEPTS